MSSNKIKKGWKRTYEKNDTDAWKKQKRQIVLQQNASDDSRKTIPPNQRASKKHRC
jgi:hypothetical protein